MERPATVQLVRTGYEAGTPRTMSSDLRFPRYASGMPAIEQARVGCRRSAVGFRERRRNQSPPG